MKLAHRKLEESLSIAKNFGIEDVSVHPPMLANASLQPPYLPVDVPEHREKSRVQLHTLLKVWIPRFQEQAITLSLESHVTASFFVFTGLPDFRDFVLNLPGLGVLVDVCHNYYDGYEIPELLSIVQSLPVTGIHLSDAIRGHPLSQATHLPIGHGTIDFKPVLAHFDDHEHVYAALEVRGSAQGIIDSMKQLRIL
jgi:sugar phosphate isomerase/epimerase